MMYKKIPVSSLMYFFLLMLNTFVFAASSGMIEGVVKDAKTGEPLPGANIMIVGTSIGAASDLNGEYVMPKVLPGEYTFRATYIGYEKLEVTIQILADQRVEQDFALKYVGVEADVVVVTAQAEGQMKAINQQLASSSIVEIVSADRIQELPDATAAESVGRLPGVSVSREGGEGTKVIIRGMSAENNKINIAGIEMAGTDAENRSVDISTISPYLLAGIEVHKTVTADADADAIGGTVNFRVREATKGLNFQVLSQAINNGLRNSTDDYKVVGSVDQRFLNDKLGVLLLVDVESRTRDSEGVTAQYKRVFTGDIENIYVRNGLLEDAYRNKDRRGGALVLDYKLANTKIKVVNFLTENDTDTETYSEQANESLALGQRTAAGNEDLKFITNSLRLEQDLFGAKLTTRVSRSHSTNDQEGGFWIFQDGSGLMAGANITTSPQDMFSFVRGDPSKQFLTTLQQSTDHNEETIWVSQTDLQYDYALSNKIAGKLKIGGKYKFRTREFDHEESVVAANLESTTDVRDFIITTFGLDVPLGTRDVPLTAFIDRNYANADFLDGDFAPGPFPDVGLLKATLRLMNERAFPEVVYTTQEINPQQVSSHQSDYDGDERLGAGYVLTEIKFGNKIEFSPGFRYERNDTKYTAVRGDPTADPLATRNWLTRHETTRKRSNDFFLPMINLRVKPKDWFDVRLAYTESISRPSFVTFIPRITITTGGITYGNADLKPSHSRNFDGELSVHSNKLGLFTLAGFYKRIEDQIFTTGNRVVVDTTAALTFEGLDEFRLDGDVIGSTITTFVNNDHTGTVRGFELGWQTHFWYLPGVLRGVVLNANYTHIFSETRYPQTFIDSFFDVETLKFTATNRDTSFEARLVGQPKDIVNLAFGYDYKGFSARASMLYQSNVFSVNDFSENLRANTDPFLRWDISIRQRLPIRNTDFTLNLVNLNSRRDKSINRGTGSPTSSENFGRNIIVGLRYRY